MNIKLIFINAIIGLIEARRFSDEPICFSTESPFSPPSQVPCNNGTNHSVKRRAPASEDKPIMVNLSCSGSKCPKVLNAFNKAADLLASFIEIKEKIFIDAKFHSFCSEARSCTIKSNTVILGKAAPANYVSLEDNDKVARLYPQSLAKQLDIPSSERSKFKIIDIVAEFNSDASFWFEGDGKIGLNQYDFFSVIAHELVHGLGFVSGISAWTDDEQFITPGFYVEKKRGSTQLKLAQFIPNALDRLIITTSDGKPLQNLLDPFIKFRMTDFVSSEEQLNSFLIKSPIAQNAKDLNKIATTENSLAVKLSTGDSLVLDTTYPNFSIGSSVSHVSGKKYKNTKEALMVPKVTSGEGLFTQGSSAESWGTSPYGPQLIAMLAELGYPIKGFSQNTGSRNVPGKPGSGDGNSGVSSFKANLNLLAIAIGFYLLY